MSDIATPPATGTWFDVDVTASAVFQILRLQGGDIDENRIRAIIPGAANRIDVYCDRAIVLDGPPPAPHIQHALEQLTLLRYLPQQPGAFVDFTGISAETHLLDTLIPGERERWGVA